MRILAVDDEQPALELLTETIEEVENDATVISYDNAEAVLEYLRNNSCDVCFLDIEMPDMTGIELAKRIKEINNKVNIIFVTGYSQYASNAFELRASGYVKKPVTVSKIKEELNNLRNPVVEESSSGIRVITFGNFDVYFKNKPLVFKRTKSKELFAYLVDRKGAGVTKKEISSILFKDSEYDRKIEDYINKIYKEMVRALKDVGIDDILVKEHNYYAVNPEMISCDRYDFENGIQAAVNSYRGEYMNQYSWASFKIK